MTLTRPVGPRHLGRSLREKVVGTQGNEPRFEIGDGQAGHLPTIIGPTEDESVGGQRFALEVRHLVGRQNSTLALHADDAVLLELLLVLRIGRDQIPLGRHMEPDETGNALAQDRPYERRRHLGVDLVTTRPQDVPDVMDQSGDLELDVIGIRHPQDGGGLEIVVQEAVQPRHGGQVKVPPGPQGVDDVIERTSLLVCPGDLGHHHILASPRPAGSGPAGRYGAVMFAVTRQRFEELVADALDSLPPNLGQTMDNVAVLVEDRAVGRSLFGLYEGIPLTRRGPTSYAGAMPDRITLYQETICSVCSTEAEVVAQVRKTVIHEVAHHFGISDPRLEELGWA
jgi:predicted Zn-dependent protease with MMP-like domain